MFRIPTLAKLRGADLTARPYSTGGLSMAWVPRITADERPTRRPADRIGVAGTAHGIPRKEKRRARLGRAS